MVDKVTFVRWETVPRYVRVQLENAGHGVIVNLTGTIRAMWDGRRIVSLWTTTGFPVSVSDLK